MTKLSSIIVLGDHEYIGCSGPIMEQSLCLLGGGREVNEIEVNLLEVNLLIEFFSNFNDASRQGALDHFSYISTVVNRRHHAYFSVGDWPIG